MKTFSINQVLHDVMQHFDFTQMFEKATTENGTLIDHVYAKILT